MNNNLILGICAHVDGGKTTLSEALLYLSGARRTFGRVDHKNAFLDTDNLERERGITIFSKQARFSVENWDVTLVDTPGHGDFVGETERVLPILDCAVLVISRTNGVQAHTVTLWQLLEKYQIPTFLFVNKMDLPGLSKEELLQQFQNRLSEGCLDFSQPDWENIAMCDEHMLETYLETGAVPQEHLQNAIAQRKLFPCCFGAGLKLEGISEFMAVLSRYAPKKTYPTDFGARVYKISRDSQGNRLTWLKVTGGALQVRAALSHQTQAGEIREEKVQQIRLYSGEKFTPTDIAPAGMLCAVTGLSATYIGQGLGAEPDGQMPALQPVMTYRVILPEGCDISHAVRSLRQLEEEEPLLRVFWDERTHQLNVQIMGKVQLEVLQKLLSQRFSLDVTFDTGRVFYKESILNSVEGVGHFEPLRHYAETHILLEPLPQGSGLQFDSICSTDALHPQYRNLIMSHLREKTHLGVLTGAPITDMKLTLLSGRAHVKHTEGGDFRQATYRAVRQGLMRAKSVLLEPIYNFMLTIPVSQVGRAMTDIQGMSGQCDAPENMGETAILTGTIPASELGDYPEQVAAYTQGHGQLQMTFRGYAPCHNQAEIIAQTDYRPESDLENTPDSVFCDHGAGVTVKWNEVENFMHLPYTKIPIDV